VHVGAVTVGLVVRPVPVIVVPVRVYKLALPLCLVVLPLAFVGCSVGPLLLAPAVPQVPHPLPLVLDAVLEPNQRFSLSRDAGIGPLQLFAHHLSLSLVARVPVELRIPPKFLVYLQQIRVLFVANLDLPDLNRLGKHLLSFFMRLELSLL
jgi:hypothetical protein